MCARMHVYKATGLNMNRASIWVWDFKGPFFLTACLNFLFHL